MNLTKRKDGRWQYKFSPGNGKKPIVFYSSLSDQKKAEKEIVRKVSAYKDKEEHGETFAAVADSWNSEYRETHSELNYCKSLKASYERIVKHFGDMYIKNISPSDINQFICILKSKKYSKKTISTHKSILNMIFTHGIIANEITINPVDAITLPTGLPKTRRRIPTTEELKIVSSHTEGFDLLPYFILYTGCRKSEALAITDKSIDWERKIIKITHHVIHDRNTPIYEPVLKTECAEREIILLDRLEKVLPQNFKGFLFSMKGDGEDPLTKKAYDYRKNNYQKKYGVNIEAHELRHGYATMLFEAGISDKDAQDLMGHSDINLTRQIYTHIRDERKQKTASILNDFNF